MKNEAEQLVKDASELPGVSLAGINLTAEEFQLLQQTVASPVMPLLHKLLARVGAQTMGMLETQGDEKEIFRLQGQIKALRWLQSFPTLMVQQQKKKSEEVKKNSQQRPSPASP